MVGEKGRGGRGEGTPLKKGPWTVEEDEVLQDFVRKHGPHDWSSIRSKGLLPRSGKSCRLRWVNKLKPDLKTGCKFSAEEERVVIELQSQFGNKWARIATYLPGRTDNDVKNFWSTRKKRLARILKSPSSPLNENSNRGNTPIRRKTPPLPEDRRDCFSLGTETINGECSSNKMSIAAEYATGVATLPSLETVFDRQQAELPPFDYPELPEELLNMSILPDVCDHGQELIDMDFDLEFFPLGLESVRTPQFFFEDFPVDMIDCSDSEQPPPPKSSSG